MTFRSGTLSGARFGTSGARCSSPSTWRWCRSRSQSCWASDAPGSRETPGTTSASARRSSRSGPSEATLLLHRWFILRATLSAGAASQMCLWTPE
ncbi:unnamed protein product [Ixodes pacificus]